jgi:hypothetical protein
MTPRQKEIQENLRLFELEKAERMKSLSYRIRLFWYKVKRKMDLA